MDARFAMADAYKALSRAGLSHAEFEAEINNCQGAEDAYRIALKWIRIANEKEKSKLKIDLKPAQKILDSLL